MPFNEVPKKSELLVNQLTAKVQSAGIVEKHLCSLLTSAYNLYYYGDELFNTMTALYGKPLSEIKSLKEFWHPTLKASVKHLISKEHFERLNGIIDMMLTCQYSHSAYRRSYHSSDIGYYTYQLFYCIHQTISWSCYGMTAAQMLPYNHSNVYGFEYQLAFDLKNNDEEAVKLVKEAITGDNSSVILSREIVEAVIISGNSELIELLTKLLLAAKLQEGVRQQILESADAGSIKTFVHFLKVIEENKLLRFSSVLRAFDVWSGLALEDERPATAEKCLRLAINYLEDEKARTAALTSSDAFEVYFSLWATSSIDITQANTLVVNLINSPEKYKQLLGLYFIHQTDSRRFTAQITKLFLDVRDEETLAWVCLNLGALSGNLYIYGQNKMLNKKPKPDKTLPQNTAEAETLFNKLSEIVKFIGKKKRSFDGSVFPWVNISLESTNPLNCMIRLARFYGSESLSLKLLDYIQFMDTAQRNQLYKYTLNPETNEAHRRAVREALKDKSISIKELAVDRLSDCLLDSEDISALASSLTSKSSSFRQSVLKVLKKQNPEILSPAIDALLQSKEDYHQQAGIELLSIIKENQPSIFEEKLPLIEKLSDVSAQTQVLLDELMPDKNSVQNEYSPENGFGLYNPASPAFSAETYKPQETPAKGLFAKFKRSDNGLFSKAELIRLLPSEKECSALFAKLNAVFEEHADYEYESLDYFGSREKVLFGDCDSAYVPIPAEYGNYRNGSREKAPLEYYPFYREFSAAAGDYAADGAKLACLLFCCNIHTEYLYRAKISPRFLSYYSGLPVEPYNESLILTFKRRFNEIRDVLTAILAKTDKEQLFDFAFKFYRSLIALMPEEYRTQPYADEERNPHVVALYGNDFPERYPSINHSIFKFWRGVCMQTVQNNEDFIEFFRFERYLYLSCGREISYSLGMEEYLRAYTLGFIDKEVVFQQLLSGESARHYISLLTQRGRRKDKLFEKFPCAEEFADTAVDRIVMLEARRGELETPLTRCANSIGYFEGAKYFTPLLASLGKENFFRGYEYSYSRTKKDTLSLLLKHCHPSKDDNPQTFKELLKNAGITDKRLAEASMYAPQWVGFAEEITGWKGLKCAVWFFHAHINEQFTAEKETETALYSPITPQQFNDGAFDKSWFLTAYNTLGEKRFQVLYKSAKYITSGSNQHRRSQLYTDAVLGRLDKNTLLEEIKEKRNQEKLRCFPLIPIDPNENGEALARYEFIQKFLKESKKFGAQRRESEAKACRTALENLAITTGFNDVNRMTWFLESEKLESIRSLLEPVSIGEVSVRLSINDDGEASLAIQKGVKMLKTIPKAIAKHEYILTLKETVKELTEQRRRAKQSLETAMTDSTRFSYEELEKLMSNPILKPTAAALVWTDETNLGFLCCDGALSLTDENGVSKPVEANALLRIAHPYDFMKQRKWADFQRNLYQRQTVQPFKQIFREYYPITEDELQEKNISRRYAGNQVQPQKTAALLKGRGWTVDYEEGLQKVFYKENLIVRIYALADWFSPADIEAPTLETVQFFDRTTQGLADFENVPPIVFSEAMRDLDLAVSVAHVGGVDPEASHSTVEMRIAIARELLSLMKADNVAFVGSHAKITGKLGKYSVHMGSGVTHAEAVGAVSILPVHSQKRGRIFLPFADDDPKTAEIISKILLLSDDSQIKDAAILKQICGN